MKGSSDENNLNIIWRGCLGVERDITYGGLEKDGMGYLQDGSRLVVDKNVVMSIAIRLRS